uniref:G domain-containing protein n=1 Tax=viral metagenome TaxID=1070528 RepID=A0A6C0ARH0_9ZZZZ
MSRPLVKIASNKLSLRDTTGIPDSGSFRVISILGKARMGKSTFLNAILSRIRGSTVKPFMTQDNDEHCTRGIDYYFCEKERLLLLDCQGLALEDSSHDPQLLLFAYLVSDVLILNERMMLQNEALKLMEPICGFMTYIDMEGMKKPQLFFRISDADLVKDPAKNLERVLTRYPDQYQSIRDSIKNLFQPSIGIVKTETMDRSLKKSLQANDYMCLFEDQLLGFQSAVDSVLAALPEGRTASEWNASLTQIIHGINHNEKISIDKLDIVRTLAELEIAQYKNTIPPALFTDIPVTAFQDSYNMLVVPRIESQQQLIADFHRKFKSVSKEIKDPHFQDLSDRLARPIDIAKKTMLQLAEQHVAPLVQTASQDRSYPSLHNLQQSFVGQPAATWDYYLIGFVDLQKAIQPLYDPVRTKYENWMKAVKRSLLDAINECIEIESENMISAAKYVSKSLKAFNTQCLREINGLTTVMNQQGKEESVLIQDPLQLVQTYITTATANATKDLGQIPTPMSICVTMINRSLRIDKEYSTVSRVCTVNGSHSNHMFPVTHDLLKQASKLWTDGIVDYTKQLTQAVTDRKKQLLYRFRFISDTQSKNLHQQIKDVDFVMVNNLDIMTVDTFDTCYMPLVRKTIYQMDEKGLLMDGDMDDLVKVYSNHSNPGTTYFPLRIISKNKLEITRVGNIVANYLIGSHPEPAIAHCFKNIHCELQALERAKPTDSLFVSRKDYI